MNNENIQNYAKNFTPALQLRSKYNAYVITIWLILIGPFNLFIWIIKNTDKTFPVEAQQQIMFGSLILSIPIAALIFYFIRLYYPTIRYEIVKDEIHVFSGLITKTRKVVPYRTITNIEIKQGPFDRFYKIGTIEVQTAGNSTGKTGPEEKIEGVPGNILQELQEHIVNSVRRIVGTPGTSHDPDYKKEDNVMEQLLKEVKSLREFLVDKAK